MRIEASSHVSGIVHTPGDKSISHRALMISALAPGLSTIRGLSDGEDVAGTRAILEKLGAVVRHTHDGLSISGGDLHPSRETLECGNSGTTVRLLCGLLGLVPGEHHLDGDESLRQRPMERVSVPLGHMGLAFSCDEAVMRLPLVVATPTHHLRALRYTLPVPSAQVKSALLFAALRADGNSVIEESIRTRSNTEDMLRQAGISLESEDKSEGRVVSISPGVPKAVNWSIPGDPSQAAFFVVLGLIHPTAQLRINQIYNGPERIGFIDVLRRMGAEITTFEGSGVMDLEVSSQELVATRISSSDIPSVDEVPALVVAASAATGTTIFTDMEELRFKESDRFSGSIALARSLGASVTSDANDFAVTGVGSARNFNSFSLPPSLDHRMVMAATVGGLAGRGVTIESPDTVATSFPTFFELVRTLTS